MQFFLCNVTFYYSVSQRFRVPEAHINVTSFFSISYYSNVILISKMFYYSNSSTSNKRFNSCFDFTLSFGTRPVWETTNEFSLMQFKSPQQALLSRFL